jgi:acetate kinase
MILIINSGSSSIKFAIYEDQSLKNIFSGALKRIGLPSTELTFFPLKTAEKQTICIKSMIIHLGLRTSLNGSKNRLMEHK